MRFTRRDALALGLGVTAASFLPLPAMASIEEATAAFTGGAQVGSGDITLTAPEIAENGNTVPIAIAAPGAAAIIVLATENPVVTVATFNFGALSGEQSASTRIRLARTQEVQVIARMADGSYIGTSQIVKVTIGGCGG